MAGLIDLMNRPAAAPDRTVHYGRCEDQVSDLWLPSAADPAPLVIVVHGGFWRAQYDRAHTAPLCTALAAGGYAACAIEYRRIGQGGGWPATFDDIALALDSIPGIFSDLVDTTRVALLGHSAGGHLALWGIARHGLPAGSRWWRPGPMRIGGVVSLAGLCDLDLAWQLRLSSDAVGSLLAGTPSVRPERYAAADPMRLLPTGIRCILVHGERDDTVPLRISRSYAAAACAAGDNVDLRVVAGADHFSVIDPLDPAWQEVLRALAEVLR